MEEETKKIEKESKPVELAQVPTQYGLVFNTPEGQMSQEEYLVWMGNKLVEIKQALIG